MLAADTKGWTWETNRLLQIPPNDNHLKGVEGEEDGGEEKEEDEEQEEEKGEERGLFRSICGLWKGGIM